MSVRVFATIALLGLLVAALATWRPVVPGTVAVDPDADWITDTDLPLSSDALAGPIAPPASDPVLLAAASPTAVRPLQRAFEQAGDLFTFRQQLQPLAASGDADARWVLSRVDEYCAGFARDPAGFARDSALISELQLDAARALGAARDRIGARCGRFVPQDAPTFVQLVEQRQDAAEAGSLAAEAALLAMGAPLQDDMDYRRGLVERVQASRDPDAFVALSPAMGVAASGDVALADTVAGTQASELAWQLAACDLGLDCSADGALMTEYCANGGICAREARQDFSAFVRDAAVPRQGADEIDRMKKTLVEGAPASRHLLGMVTP
ncbi:conserved hypothetical protein [Luteimonas sp. 9C]|uniref:hypothetical protein n=1 Tax=Luteimonas sp. 9C TaxID=2653148 RepID=UPI0012F224BC|nr:hypothetical protein [Luteimonas sp. 9C]VXA92285.1 conserved hypothetical protein [Luteimonas sp. 9C]